VSHEVRVRRIFNGLSALSPATDRPRAGIERMRRPGHNRVLLAWQWRHGRLETDRLASCGAAVRTRGLAHRLPGPRGNSCRD